MRILLIEDDPQSAALAVQALEREGHSLGIAADGREALARGACEPWDLLIIDRMLPHLDGLSLVRMLRAGGVTAPALFLTALGDVADRVAGLQAGGDDYLVKPFSVAELSARVEALGRRREVARGPVTALQFGDLWLDLLTRTARHGERLVELQNVEFRILERLMRSAGRVVTRSMLLEDIWGIHFEPRTNLVESNISRLRSKIGQSAFATGPIETVRGVGYRLRAESGR
jgi:two-component system OmpR family response regulator